MKFTKEQAFEKIKGYLSNNGKKTLSVSDITINAHIETLMSLLANEDTELDDFVNQVRPLFQSVDDNTRNDNSTFVKNWEKEHQKDEKGGGTPAKKETTATAAVSPEMQALLDRVAQLEQANKDAEIKSVLSEKRSSLVKKLGEKGVKDKEWIESFLDEVNITAETDIDTMVAKYVKLYNRANAKAPASVTPRGGAGGNSTNNPLAGASAYMKQQRESKEKLLNNN